LKNVPLTTLAAEKMLSCKDTFFLVIKSIAAKELFAADCKYPKSSAKIQTVLRICIEGKLFLVHPCQTPMIDRYFAVHDGVIHGSLQPDCAKHGLRVKQCAHKLQAVC
jgi:hypothetical protein